MNPAAEKELLQRIMTRGNFEFVPMIWIQPVDKDLGIGMICKCEALFAREDVGEAVRSADFPRLLNVMEKHYPGEFTAAKADLRKQLKKLRITRPPPSCDAA